MEEGLVQIYSGEGHGKSAAAIGRALQVACNGENVVIIRFLKGMRNDGFLKRLEPEIKIFRFERAKKNFPSLLQRDSRKRFIISRMVLILPKKY